MAYYRGAGTVVELGSTNNPGTAVFTVLTQVTNVQVREQSGELEVTNLGSTRKEYIQDLADSAMLSFTLFYDPAIATQNEVSGLEALFNSGATRVIRITPNGSSRRENYVGFVMSKNKNFEPSQPQRMEVEFRATGAVTYTPV
jgi:hypothetical protein